MHAEVTRRSLGEGGLSVRATELRLASQISSENPPVCSVARTIGRNFLDPIGPRFRALVAPQVCNVLTGGRLADGDSAKDGGPENLRSARVDGPQ
jgi:hypothetical protein